MHAKTVNRTRHPVVLEIPNVCDLSMANSYAQLVAITKSSLALVVCLRWGPLGSIHATYFLEAWRSLRGLDRWPNPPAVLASATINHVTVMSNGLRCTLRDVFLSLLRHPETQPQRSGTPSGSRPCLEHGLDFLVLDLGT